MKTTIMAIMIATILSASANNLNAQNTDKQQQKILVAYYSWSGNTRIVAQQIQKITDGDIFEIVPAQAYPEDYTKCTEQAKKEINNGYQPPLKNKLNNIGDYDIIFVGSPNWWSTIAPPVATFLSEHDLSGKMIVPFCTHGGGREARIFADIKKLVPQSTLAKGFVVDGNRVRSARPEVEKWLREININSNNP